MSEISMATLDAKNKSADEFIDSHIPIMKEICEPLNALNITHFSYNKFVGKEKALILCPQMSKFRERFGYSLDIDIVQPQLDQIYQQKEFLFWQNFGPGNPVLEALREYDVNHGFTLFRTVEKDIYESFHFATTNDNEQIKNYYFKNLSFLYIFSDYFIDKMSDIIDHQIPGKLLHIESPK
jgi:hypothetical protein